MENLESILQLLFRRIAPKAVIRGRVSGQSFGQEDFVRAAFGYITKYSETELTNMWRYYKEIFERDRRMENRAYDPAGDGISVFDALFYYVNRMLVVQNNEILCRYNELLDWRMLTFKLSEDLLVSSYWAGNWTPEGMRDTGYSWKTVIGHNNVRLNRIMQRGISENHFHLMGSAPIFHISWLSLMNEAADPKVTRHLEDYDSQRRNANLRYSADYEEEALKVQCYQAVLIRLFLFSVLTEERIEIGSYYVSHSLAEGCLNLSEIGPQAREEMEWPDQVNLAELEKNLAEHPEWGDVLNQEYFQALWKERTTHNVLEILQDRYQLEENLFAVQDVIDALKSVQDRPEYQGNALVDYALRGMESGGQSLSGRETIFSGERWFLYSCLRKIYQGKWGEQYQNLFYAYLLIKESIRGELIQSNDNVGFENFRVYQDRKEDLIENGFYKNEMVRLAVREDLMSGHLLSLELRISPSDTVQNMTKRLKNMDQIIGPDKDRYFYTVHFIKTQDEEIQGEYVRCRHARLRRRLDKSARVLIQLRERYPDWGKRILGIDAASAEVGCRPEVFGPCFRRLKSHVKLYSDAVESYELPQLRITYHVGEEFLDVADGLRAIDEAINFLNMDCGDRLGHALALGIDVEEWYRSKGNRILIPQQDYLDNLVWIHQRLIQFGMEGMDVLKAYIEKKYAEYFHKIYGQNMNYQVIDRILKMAGKEYGNLGIASIFHNDRFQFDIAQYYNAWKIREDDPAFYEKGYFC